MATTTTTQLAKLTFYAGTKRGLNFTVADFDADPLGAIPLNLTAFTIKWSLARMSGGKYQKTYVVQKTSAAGDGVTKTDAAAGKCRVELLRVDTEDLLGDFHQELELFDVDGESQVVAVGDVSILLNVTNT